MPLISRFFGISIFMYFEDHAPPHFHAQYGDSEVIINIRTLQVMAGNISPRALGLVIEWATIHQQALIANWTKAIQYESIDKIEPLK